MAGTGEWPAEAILRVAPYQSSLHAPGSVSRRGLCTWGDDGRPARWSVLWRGSRWACCDEHLAGYARAELLDYDGPASTDLATTSPPDAAQRESAPLSERFHQHVMAGVARLRGRYNPTEFRAMVERHGALGAAKQLLGGHRHTSYGFERLWELNALDTSVEFAACLPWFRELFTPAELDEAERRLVLHDFPLQQRLDHAAQTPPAWLTNP